MERRRCDIICTARLFGVGILSAHIERLASGFTGAREKNEMGDAFEAAIEYTR